MEKRAFAYANHATLASHADLVQVLDKGPVTGPLHRDGVPPKGRRTSPETAIPTAEEGPAPGPASAVKPFAATLAAIDAAIARASSEEGRGSSSSHGPVFEQGAAPAADYSPVFEQDAVVTSDDDYVKRASVNVIVHASGSIAMDGSHEAHDWNIGDRVMTIGTGKTGSVVASVGA